MPQTTPKRKLHRISRLSTSWGGCEKKKPVENDGKNRYSDVNSQSGQTAGLVMTGVGDLNHWVSIDGSKDFGGFSAVQ